MSQGNDMNVISGGDRTFKLDADKLFTAKDIDAGFIVGFFPTSVPCTIDTLTDSFGNDITAALGYGVIIDGSAQTMILENQVPLIRHEKGIGSIKANVELMLLIRANV